LIITNIKNGNEDKTVSYEEIKITTFSEQGTAQPGSWSVAGSDGSGTDENNGGGNITVIQVEENEDEDTEQTESKTASCEEQGLQRYTKEQCRLLAKEEFVDHEKTDDNDCYFKIGAQMRFHWTNNRAAKAGSSLKSQKHQLMCQMSTSSSNGSTEYGSSESGSSFSATGYETGTVSTSSSNGSTEYGSSESVTVESGFECKQGYRAANKGQCEFFAAGHPEYGFKDHDKEEGEVEEGKACFYKANGGSKKVHWRETSKVKDAENAANFKIVCINETSTPAPSKPSTTPMPSTTMPSTTPTPVKETSTPAPSTQPSSAPIPPMPSTTPTPVKVTATHKLLCRLRRSHRSRRENDLRV
jgi:hypothetical protein